MFLKEPSKMIDKKVWRPALRNSDRSRIIRSQMFLKKKFLPQGEFEKLNCFKKTVFGHYRHGLLNVTAEVWTSASQLKNGACCQCWLTIDSCRYTVGSSYSRRQVCDVDLNCVRLNSIFFRAPMNLIRCAYIESDPNALLHLAMIWFQHRLCISEIFWILKSSGLYTLAIN